MLIKDSWTPALGEALLLKGELHYCKDEHTVAVLKKFGASQRYQESWGQSRVQL